MISLYDHQQKAIEKLKTGSILQGGVGSGKSLTALAYYVKVHFDKPLYIITTAKHRDDKHWVKESHNFPLQYFKTMQVDSWNNIHKYKNVKHAFFIFDEQHLVGSGVWAKAFLRIAEVNDWILLSATPGDRWLDYIPVFIANGFYKNRSEFLRRHVVFKRWSKFPVVDYYIETRRLIKLRDEIIVPMHFNRQTTSHHIKVVCDYDKELYDFAVKKRWDSFKQKPIRDASLLCYVLRKIVNSDTSRLKELEDIYHHHGKVIVFYNFDYELDILKKFLDGRNWNYREWNGHKHDGVYQNAAWFYLVQYAAGAEGWNCVDTNCIVFYSQNYSYRTMLQAAGRIDRINTNYSDLYNYYFLSESSIDKSIREALKNKKNFNEREYAKYN